MDQNNKEDDNLTSNQAGENSGEPDNSLATDGVVSPGTGTVNKADSAMPDNSAETKMAEVASIAPEVEPATEAFTPPEPTSQTPTEASPNAANPQPAINSVAHEPISNTSGITASSSKSKRRIIIAGLAFVLIAALIGGITWWLMADKSSSNSTADNTVDTLSSSTAELEQSANLTTVEGQVEYSKDGNEWLTTTGDTKLEKGASIRTSKDSRAIVALKDGSAVRLGSDTEVSLADLSDGKVEIKQVKGMVYSRVMPIGRDYIVSVDGTSYQAKGTAFLTIKDDKDNGVQVYQSSVKVDDMAEAVGEGMQYFKTNSDPELQAKITDIDIDALAEDAFIQWNITQDENNANYKDSLGFLSQIQNRNMQGQVQTKPSPSANQEESQDTPAKQSDADNSTSRRSDSENDVSQRSIILSYLDESKTIREYVNHFTHNRGHAYQYYMRN